MFCFLVSYFFLRLKVFFSFSSWISLSLCSSRFFISNSSLWRRISISCSFTFFWVSSPFIIWPLIFLYLANNSSPSFFLMLFSSFFFLISSINFFFSSSDLFFCSFILLISASLCALNCLLSFSISSIAFWICFSSFIIFLPTPEFPEICITKSAFPIANNFFFINSISSWYCLNKASLGSSLILGLFLIFLALWAYHRVFNVSS